jgi:glucose-1-phosphate thymidylyltransferase
MKGIILAGGNGSRLYPITIGVSKQLLPVYDKPMVYYPLSTLMQAGIKEIMLISTPNDLPNYKRLMGDGKQWGLTLNYKEQKHPKGLAEAFIISENFIGKDSVCLILGDNIFYGNNFYKNLKKLVIQTEKTNRATIFGYTVKDPKRYGVIEFDSNLENVISIEEKPKEPKSDKAVVGLYFYPNTVINVSKEVKPSDRDELEITSVNQIFLKQKLLNVEILSTDFYWLDTGTYDSLLEAGNFIRTIEKRQGLKIACIEEISFLNGLISKKDLLQQAKKLLPSPYGQYILKKYSN